MRNESVNYLSKYVNLPEIPVVQYRSNKIFKRTKGTAFGIFLSDFSTVFVSSSFASIVDENT